MSDKITYGVIGLLAGVVIAWPIVSTTANNQHINLMRTMHSGSAMDVNMMGGIMDDETMASHHSSPEESDSIVE